MWGHTMAVLAVLVVLAVPAVDGHGYLFKPTSRNIRHNELGEESGPMGLRSDLVGVTPCGHSNKRDYTTVGFDDEVAEREGNTLHPGGVLEIESAMTAHHMGHFEVYLCTDASRTDLFACFLETPLMRSREHEHLDPAPIDERYPGRWYLPPSGLSWPRDAKIDTGRAPSDETYRMWYTVPENVTCAGGRCLLLWYWVTNLGCIGRDYDKYFTEVEGGQYYPRDRAAGLDGRWILKAPTSAAMCDTKIPNYNPGPESTYPKPQRYHNCADMTLARRPSPPQTTPRPASPTTPRPATPVTPLPATPNTPTPATPDTPRPATPNTPTPATPNTPRPATPRPVVPATPRPAPQEEEHYFNDYSLGGGFVKGSNTWKHRCGCKRVSWPSRYTSEASCVEAWKAQGTCADPSSFAARHDEGSAGGGMMGTAWYVGGGAVAGVAVVAAVGLLLSQRRKESPPSPVPDIQRPMVDGANVEI